MYHETKNKDFKPTTIVRDKTRSLTFINFSLYDNIPFLRL